ncbi:hypothetical protein BDZ91DRAFT_735431, partial [Kalaharituber pfeilii]
MVDGFRVDCFMTMYRVQIEFCIVVICTAWTFTFEWTEIYPHPSRSHWRSRRQECASSSQV